MSDLRFLRILPTGGSNARWLNVDNIQDFEDQPSGCKITMIGSSGAIHTDETAKELLLHICSETGIEGVNWRDKRVCHVRI